MENKLIVKHKNGSHLAVIEDLPEIYSIPEVLQLFANYTAFKREELYCVYINVLSYKDIVDDF